MVKRADVAQYDLRTLPKDERPRPSSGQSGPQIELPWDSMNSDEQRVCLKLYAEDEPMSIAELSETGFGRENPKLRVRNANRRLVCGDWIVSVPEDGRRGVFKMTANGKRRMSARGKAKKKSAA